ncbi:septal ring lytic transglycosylase RlpA family protein [Undibacterium sp. SXout7W]|uniref:septal ring lytic transglycosylase RlpA family protein n=1 Tax=Undibacterium sp. SXout7W TaxID=3413049 RepID=UPI003BF09EDA
MKKLISENKIHNKSDSRTHIKTNSRSGLKADAVVHLKTPRPWRLPLVCAATVLLAACGSAPKQSVIIAESSSRPAGSKPSGSAPLLPKANSGKGGYYKDDGPGDNPPEGLEFTVDPIPVVEDFSRAGNKPYVVFGKTYTPVADNVTPYIQRGIASWYGKKFHGQKTSSGELYDMYKITAAHPTLPIPSYARVTNLNNGKQIIVRINDRGPFHSSRIIDLSYTAALKLEVLGKGSSQIEVERLLPVDIERMAENRKNQTPEKSILARAPVVTMASPINTPMVNTIDVPPVRNAADKAAITMATASNMSNANNASTAQMTIEELLASQDSKPVEKLASGSVSGVGYYLQFGAYAIRANAESIMTQLKNRAESALPGFDIVQQGSLYRLVSGPFGSRSEATAALAQAGNLGIARPLVVQR